MSGSMLTNSILSLSNNLMSYIIQMCLNFVNNLLNNFFYDAFAVETNFYDMVNRNTFNIVSLYHAIYIFAISILIMLFVKKMVETYFAWSNGDPDNSPLQVLIGFVKALIIMVSFGFLYETFVDIMNSLYQSITNSAFGDTSGLADLFNTQKDWVNALLNSMGMIFYVIIAIQYVLVYFQNLSRGIEVLILRLGIPFASVGLLNADGGVFRGYIQQFIKVAFTVIVQLTLLRLSITFLLSTHIILALATSTMALKTPGILSQFLITYGGTDGRAGKIVHNVGIVASMMKKH